MTPMQEHIRKQLYTVSAFAAASDPRMRLDANETAFLESQLMQHRQKTLEVQYPDNIALQLVPRATDIDPEAKTYSTHVIDRRGRAKVIAAGAAANDIPRVDVKIDEILGTVAEIADSFGFSLSELRTAARLGTPIEAWKGRAARSAVEDEIDQMVAKGETSTQTSLGVTGFVNNANVSLDTTSFTVWSSSDTSDALIAELMKPASAINVTVKNKGSLLSNTLALAPVNYDIIATKPMGSGSDLTVLKFFLLNNPYITSVVQWSKLALANAGGNGARAVCYRRDPEVLESVVPLLFEQLPPQAQGLELVTICRARAGGVKVYHPEAMLYLDHTG
jgi:hypothetical protein